MERTPMQFHTVARRTVRLRGNFSLCRLYVVSTILCELERSYKLPNCLSALEVRTQSNSA